ncbi:MAG TPA: RnfABCDGE type electron transport complex subunit B, partial [Steroidobacteraceae bacterium]|nr:RnfABCDGE type electron transport complex subunit B [Steroidobacteraceae bacterium]
AEINQCPPGGAATIDALATLLHRDARPLNPANGVEGPPLVAQIDETLCIGCAKCLPPCPVDAIVGARKQMHSVLVELCTGCELCIAPCPVDCISLVPRSSLVGAPPEPKPRSNRERFYAHNARIERRAQRQAVVLANRKQAARPSSTLG